MASSGNPNQQPQGAGFDMNKLMKPTSGPMNMNTITQTSSSNLTTSPSFPTPSSPSPPPFLTPSSSYPPSSPYPFHHHPPPHFVPYHPPSSHHLPNRPPPLSFWPPSQPPPPPTSSSDPLMSFFANQSHPHSDLPHQQSSPTLSPVPSSSDFSGPPHAPSAPPFTMVTPLSSSSRLLSSKLPKGRHLAGSHVVYDIDVRFPGEVQPQLEVTPITKYASDPGLVLGRQIAVNRNYICYGLKLGAIRILNIITAMRSLFRGHTQRVTDMAFFAEDVNLLASASADGRVFIWKINEGPDEEDKPQIFGKVVLAIQIDGQWESIHPRLCWHPHKQEILMIAIGNCILKVDTIKVARGAKFSAEEPLNCHIDKLIDGLQLFGRHDDEITELSMCQWMTTRLASASKDGTVKIWEDRKAAPLAVLRPHSGSPVNSVTFLTAPDRPDHIVLVTGGPLNRELKVWSSASEVGWLMPSDAESWQCTQTLELKSSAESKIEDAFFNQAVALPHASLFLLANAKKNAIYAIHIDYGPNPSSTRVDYIAEFTVTMPILSLTGTSEGLPGEHSVHVYCVQTQAIQQYALDLFQCLPPPLENTELEKTDASASASPGNSAVDTKSSEMSVNNSISVPPIVLSSSESTQVPNRPEGLTSSEGADLPEITGTTAETKPSTLQCDDIAENTHTPSPPLPLSPRLSQKSSGLKSPSKSLEPSPFSDNCVVQPITATESKADVTSSDDVQNFEKNVAQSDVSVVKHPTHLVTPSEILSTVASSLEKSHGTQEGEAKVQDVPTNNDAESSEVETEVVGEGGNNSNKELEVPNEPHGTIVEKEKSFFYSQASDLGVQVARDIEAYSTGGSQQASGLTLVEGPAGASNTEEDQSINKDLSAKKGELEAPVLLSQAGQAIKGKKHKTKSSQVPGTISPSPSPYNSTDSSNEPACSFIAPSLDALMTQLLSMQDMLNQLISTQKEMHKQMTSAVSGPINKEGKRLETSLGRSIERVVKAHLDALWAHFQEENLKREKLEREQMQQIVNLITNFESKELPALFEKSLKKEFAAIGPAVARAIAPTLEKCISSAIVESFQRGLGDKAVNQLEKSVSSKLEATLARQIQTQFQTSGKQALQDALRSALESSIIPAFEMSCKAMFEQVDATFQKGLIKHMAVAQQQFETSHSPLAVALRDAISSASSITRTLSGELADGQRKLLAIATVEASSKAGSRPQGSLTGLHEIQAEVSIDPTTELSRLVAEHKYEEAFTGALHRSDVSIVSWLCSQVDLHGILSMVPVPLSQGVLLALLQQLACDISKDTPRKLSWITDVAVAINPTDPTIAVHVRPIFEQVYQILSHQRTLPTTSASEASSIRLLVHVINSVLMSCK